MCDRNGLSNVFSVGQFSAYHLFLIHFDFRSCLNLIQDNPEKIQEEQDLIASLALLDEFGVKMLPLQGTVDCHVKFWFILIHIFRQNHHKIKNAFVVC